MSLVPWLQLVHVIAAIAWVGGGMVLSLIGLRIRRTDDPRAIHDFAGVLSYIGLRIFMPAVVLVLVTGVWMVLVDSEWSFGQAWVLLALGAFALAFLIGAVYLSRVAIGLERVATGTAESLAPAREALARWLTGYGVVLAILLFALWDMVFQPGLS